MTSILSLRGSRSKSYNSLNNEASTQLDTKVVGTDLSPKKFKISAIKRKVFKPKTAANVDQKPKLGSTDLEQGTFICGDNWSTATDGKGDTFLEDNPFNNNVHSDYEDKDLKKNGLRTHNVDGVGFDPIESSDDFEDDSFNVRKFPKPDIRLSLASKLQKMKFLKETQRERLDGNSSERRNEMNSDISGQSKPSPVKSPRLTNLKSAFDKVSKSKSDPQTRTHLPRDGNVKDPHKKISNNQNPAELAKNRNFSDKVKAAIQSLSPSKSRSPVTDCPLSNCKNELDVNFDELFIELSCPYDSEEDAGYSDEGRGTLDEGHGTPDSGITENYTPDAEELKSIRAAVHPRSEYLDSGVSSGRRDTWYKDGCRRDDYTKNGMGPSVDDLYASFEGTTPSEMPGSAGEGHPVRKRYPVALVKTPLNRSGSSTPSLSISKSDITAASTPYLPEDLPFKKTNRSKIPQSISTYGFIETQSSSSKESFDSEVHAMSGVSSEKPKKLPRNAMSFSSVNLNQLQHGRRNAAVAGSLMDCSKIDEEYCPTFAAGDSKRRKLKKKFTSMEFKAILSRHSGGSIKMGAGDNVHEEASLLGGEGPEELRHIRLSVSAVRSLVADGSLGEPRQVETEHGPVTISVVGDTTKPTILTYHDLGLNHVTNFQSFFQYPDMRSLLNCFSVVSVNAPGQEEGAPNLPAGYVYPNMEQLAETVELVRAHLNLRSFIGFGVGLGANVLTRYALIHPQHVDALVLLNCSVGSSGWVEWGYQKLNIRQLRAGNMTTGTVDYLLWHHFGKMDQCSEDVVTVYKQLFESHVNAANLALLIEAYIARTDLGIVREMDPNKKKGARMVRVPVLNVTSNFSPHIDDTVAFNGRLDPANSSWMKIQDCGLVLEEQPGKMVEALRLFLQGQGYVVGGASRRASCVPQSGGEALPSY